MNIFSDLFGGFWSSPAMKVVWQYVIFFSPVIAALFLAKVFFDVWLRYIRIKNFYNMKYTQFELKLPRDQFRSPLAMETILHAIHNTSDGTWISQYWKGETRPWYSLELISIEGQVKFVIWCEDRRKKNLMTALYSQYPGIEIKEIDDYAKDVQFDPKIWKVWGTEFQFTKDDAYPIKTYIDYGLDKTEKEEFKVDPITQVLEWLGSLRPNEQAWFQFIIRAHKDDQIKPGTFWGKHDAWKKNAEDLIKKITLRDPKTKLAGKVDPTTGVADPTQPFRGIVSLTPGESDLVEALERSISKLAFDVCVRTLYIAKKDVFDTPFGIGGVISSMKQYNTEHMNGFKMTGKWINKVADYPWQDYKNIRRNYLSNSILKAYRRRSAFYPPYENSKILVLNTEELATIYHLPGQVAMTPTLERVPSKRGEAPTNLPV